MQYAFKVTANRNIGGSKGIAKGMTVQISKEGSAPNINDILAAYDPQLGIKITGISVTTELSLFRNSDQTPIIKESADIFADSLTQFLIGNNIAD